MEETDLQFSNMALRAKQFYNLTWIKEDIRGDTTSRQLSRQQWNGTADTT